MSIQLLEYILRTSEYMGSLLKYAAIISIVLLSCFFQKAKIQCDFDVFLIHVCWLHLIWFSWDHCCHILSYTFTGLKTARKLLPKPEQLSVDGSGLSVHHFEVQNIYFPLTSRAFVLPTFYFITKIVCWHNHPSQLCSALVALFLWKYILTTNWMCFAMETFCNLNTQCSGFFVCLFCIDKHFMIYFVTWDMMKVESAA